MLKQSEELLMAQASETCSTPTSDHRCTWLFKGFVQLFHGKLTLLHQPKYKSKQGLTFFLSASIDRGGIPVLNCATRDLWLWHKRDVTMWFRAWLWFNRFVCYWILFEIVYLSSELESSYPNLKLEKWEISKKKSLILEEMLIGPII